jgi:hypothetical protein
VPGGHPLEQPGAVRRPWFLPVAVGLLTFAFVWIGQTPPGVYGDFDYFWASGRAVWQGENPYTVVDSLSAHGALRSPYYYPATAAVILAPFGALSRQLAVSLFTALGMALLSFSLPGYRRWILVSPPAIQALLFGQWSPWLTAAVGLPWLGFVWAAKPSVGLALFVGWPSRRALYGGLAVVLLSFVLMPSWPGDWLAAVRSTPHYTAPVWRPGGILLLLAFLRWRQPEGRLLGALAVIPHTVVLYEQLPLLLIPQNARRFALSMGLSYLSYLLAAISLWYSVAPTAAATEAERVSLGLANLWPFYLALVYLPALYFVLRPPPTASPVPSPALL